MADHGKQAPQSLGTSGGKSGMSPVPIIVVILAVVVAGVLYISLRNQPNYQEETDIGDQPAPVETST